MGKVEVKCFKLIMLLTSFDDCLLLYKPLVKSINSGRTIMLGQLNIIFFLQRKKVEKSSVVSDYWSIVDMYSPKSNTFPFLAKHGDEEDKTESQN